MGEMAEYYSGDYGDVMDEPEDDNDNDDPSHSHPLIKPDWTPITDWKVSEKRQHFYGYGIVDNDGRPFLNEHHEDVRHVSRDISDMEELVDDLNRDKDDRAPYRVVRLLYQEMDKSDESQYR